MRALSRLLPALIFFMAGSLLVVMLGKLGTFGVVEASQRGDRVEVRLEQERASRGPAPWNQAGRSGTVPAHSLFLRFSQPMVPKERLGEIAEGLPVQMDPPVILQGWWRGYDLLEILPEAPYRRATLYRLHLDPDLVSLTGLPLARTDPLEFRSPGLRWYHLGFVDDRERPSPAVDKQDGKGPDQEAGLLLDLRFDLPLRKKDLQQHLSVTDRKESPRTILGLEEVPESLGKHWVVQVPRWETSESRTQEGTRWFVVRIDKGLRPRGHALALEKPLVRSLRIGNRRSTIESGETIEDLFFRSAKAGPGRIRLDFERSIGIPLAGMVQVDPAIAFQVHGTYSGLDLVGDFPPGKTIELRLSKGFPGFGRHRLPDELVQLVSVPDLPSKIDFSSSGRILSAKARPEIEVEISNLDRAELSVRSLYSNNYMSFAHRENRDHAFGPWKTREIRLAGPRNEAWHERLDLGALLGDEVLGIHEVRIVARDPRRGHVTSWNHRILQITDLGISVRMAKGQVAVRVHGLAKGDPVADADLRILTPTNQVLSEGRTDGRGVALLTCPTGPTDSVPFVVDVRKGADRCVLDLRSFGVELYEKGQAGRAYVGDGLEAWLQTDRGIVRPGETMHLTALVRDGSGDVPLGRKLRLEWKDPRGRVLARQDLECPASGLLIADLETRPESATGTWSAWLSEADQVIGETRFRVGAFVPERLEARVSTVGDMHQGQRAVVQIEGHWLDGAPAEARRGKLRIRFDRNRRAPDWLKGWSHTDGETPVSPGAQKPIPFVLDADGRARLAVPIPKARIGQQFLRATVLAEVQDPSGRVVRATTEAVAGPSDFVLATRLVGEKAEIALFDPEGERLDRCGKLQVGLQARRWTSSWSWYRGRWRWRSLSDRDQGRPVDLHLVSGAAALDVSA